MFFQILILYICFSIAASDGRNLVLIFNAYNEYYVQQITHMSIICMYSYKISLNFDCFLHHTVEVNYWAYKEG